MEYVVTRMARRAGPPDKKKGEAIQVRCTAAQKAELQAAAERAGVSLSAWLIQLALKAARRSDR